MTDVRIPERFKMAARYSDTTLAGTGKLSRDRVDDIRFNK